jgi:predicted lipoprotein
MIFIKYIITTTCLILLSAGLMSCGQKNPSVEFAQNTSSRVIAVAYNSLHQDAILLHEQSQNCLRDITDYAAVLRQVKPQWINAWAAWQLVQWVQFGPIKQGGREWALQFWPDKRNLVGNKIKRLLINKDFINDKAIEKDGVVVQGFSALEYLLFDKSAQALFSTKQRCLSINSIAKKIQITSESLNRDWHQYHQDNFLNVDKPLPQAEILATQQAVSIIINSMVAAMDTIIGRKISTPFAIITNSDGSNKINYNDKKSHAYFLESWRSQTSIANIKQNISALQNIISVGGLSELLIANDSQQLSQDLSDQITALLLLLESEAFDQSFFMQLSQDKLPTSKHIKNLYSGLIRLRKLLSTDVSQLLGVKLGFNASDGDS